MTALALSASAPSEFASTSLPSLPEIAQTAALGALDTAGRVVQAVEQGVDAAAQVVSVTVPAVSRFIGGFVLPEHLNRVLGTVIEYGSAGISGLAAAGAKATAQTMSFGAPAWIETLRQGVGVSAVASELKQGESSREFLARCFAESTSEPLIRESLLKYLELRKDLGQLQQAGATEPEKIGALSREIAHFEVKLRDYQDFSSLKMILAKGDEFVTEQHKRINQLAHDTADRIVQRVEQYYQDACGSYAGKIEGSWSSADTEEKKVALRTALTEKIALRLQKVFDKEMSATETVAALEGVTTELHSAFGTYRSALKATLYTVLGVGYATGAFRYLADVAGNAIKESAGSAIEWVRDSVASAAESLEEGVHAGLKSCWDYCYNFVADVANDAINKNPVIATIKQGATAISDTADSVTSAVSNATESLSEKVSNIFGSSGPDYSSPYWTRTNKVLMGYGTDGAPIYGESCISGFPSEPRIGGSLSDFSALREVFEKPVQATDLLQPGKDLGLKPEDAAKLMEFLRQK